MLKALLLDMDETLCDTRGANAKAKQLMAYALEQKFGGKEQKFGGKEQKFGGKEQKFGGKEQKFGDKEQQFGGKSDNTFNGKAAAEAYVSGIYREWNETQRARYLPIIEQQSEGAFRVQLIRDLLADQGITQISAEDAQTLQDNFDRDRLAAFHFYPGIREFLAEARQFFTLVVITNGPEFSQIPKIEAVNMAEHVDHIIIGGQEPEQKPAASIFYKALQLAGCEAHEAIHVGDSLAADIAGAHNSGITSVWIQHQQPLDAELGIDPHHTVLHPSEIPALIFKLHNS